MHESWEADRLDQAKKWEPYVELHVCVCAAEEPRHGNQEKEKRLHEEVNRQKQPQVKFICKRAIEELRESVDQKVGEVNIWEHLLVRMILGEVFLDDGLWLRPELSVDMNDWVAQIAKREHHDLVVAHFVAILLLDHGLLLWVIRGCSF